LSSEEESQELSEGRIPKHIGIIMDGNGRWAEQRGLPRLAGHAEGAKAVRRTVMAAREMGVKALTLYAFSSQNWSRPPEEISGLMQQLYDYLYEERDTMLKNEIRLRSIGNVDRLPDFVTNRQRMIEEETAHCDQMTLSLALSYGGREEILEATRSIAAKVERGALKVDDIDEECFERHTYTHDLPPLDLLIRSSGELRLSNFLLWQAAYSELLFVDALWPDFGKAELTEAVRVFARRSRRFGKTAEQFKEGA
jgi:undecaprenyl diphosphate synthase